MAGFGQAPVFGAQALPANAPTFSTSSPFGAPPTQSSPFAAPQQQQPPTAFGASSSFASNSLQQQPASSSVFGAPANATNGVTAAPSVGGGLFGDSSTTNSAAAAAAAAAAVNNPFAAAASSNPFTTQMQTAPTSSSPFGSATAPPAAQSNAPSSNPFAPVSSASPFASASNTTGSASLGVFGQPNTQLRSSPSPSPFATSATNTQKQNNEFNNGTSAKGWAAASSSAAFAKPQSSFAAPSTSKASIGFGSSDASKSSNGFADHLKENKPNGFGSMGAASAKSLAAKGQRKSPATYAMEIHQQLSKDRLKPPPWPANPGDPNNLKVMDDYRVKYKAYEDRVRASLIKAGLIDDPEVRKKLSDAIDFRGICEEHCPEGEKISRIVEHDVKFPERTHSGGYDDGWANPDLMVKTFKRSAAGTDSPLPTEVRSPAALRRSVDYLIDDLLKSDENLPTLHGFLWDRTRAIRKDFIFQNAMTPEERIDQIYCLENITRFHAVSLHLLSRDGKEDFSEQQEREQLGKTLLSLMQVYDECKDIGIRMENEAEFRAYYLLFNAHDTFVIQQMQDWSKDFWSNSSEIQTAVTLIEAMRNVFSHRGPLRPAAPLTTGSPSFTSYFSIIENPGVSYTMACLAEIHFTEIRKQILKGLHRAYGRVRDGPKDLTAPVLNEQFRFDPEEECIDFLNELDMEFSAEGASEPYLVVQRRRGLPSKTVKQSFSEAMVEMKRGNRSLPEVVHTTVFQQDSGPLVEMTNNADDLFVAQPPSVNATPKALSTPTHFSLSETESRSPSPGLMSLNQSLPPTSSSIFNNPKSNAAPKNPFAMVAKPVADTNPTASSAPLSQNTAFGWPSSASAQPSQTLGSTEPKRLQTPTASFTFPATGKTSTISGNSSQPTATPQDAPKQKSSVFGTTSSFFPSGPSTSTTTTKEQANHPTKTAGNAATTSSASDSDLFSCTATLMGNTTAPNPAAAPASTSSFFASQAQKVAQPPAAPSAPAAIVKPASPVPASAVAQDPQPRQPVKPEAPRDLMADFTKWVLLGDGGLMENLQDSVVEVLVSDAFEQYHHEEKERLKREEDERSWAEALKFRNWNLRVKYFYRWREISRKSAARRVGRSNREALRAYREAKAAEARAAKKRKEKEEQALMRKSTVPPSWLTELDKERASKRARRESMSLGTSRRSSNASEADALMASGVFRGMPNGGQAAVDSVRDDDSIYDALVGVKISPNPTRQIMGPPAKPAKDPLQSVRDSRVSKPSPKQFWSKKAQLLAGIFQPKRKEDDLLSFRSSTSSRLGQSVRSVPSSGKSTNVKDTNFTRYQSSSPRSSTEGDRARSGPNSGLKTTYWLLRDRGLFATPTGHVLSDRAPLPRSSSLQELGSQYSGDGSEMGDYDDRVLEQDGAYRASLGMTGTVPGGGVRRPNMSNSPTASARRPTFMNPSRSFGQSGPDKGAGGHSPSYIASHRQSRPAGRPSSIRSSSLRPSSRNNNHDDVDDDDESHQHKTSTMSAMDQDIEATLRELKRVADEMDEDTTWYREQNRQMSQSQDLGP